ncbi:MAG: hypothetical protein MUC96_00595 [Myxococcaceae bacterium]|jgi:hypothetical protein|nr:hypothetical protein [Myxococcaceae bacterium]
MGDSTIVGSKGFAGAGSLSSVEHLDANTIPTQHYTKEAKVGDATVYLTPADAERLETWDKTEVSIHKNRTTKEAAVETFKDLVRWLRS